MDTTLSLACCCHFCKALIQIYLSHTLLFQRLFVSIMTKTLILGRCGARFLLPSGAPSKCEASHSTCCSARGWWVSSWRCWWSPWWCSRCSSSPEDCMCDDCLYYEWEEVTVETVESLCCFGQAVGMRMRNMSKVYNRWGSWCRKISPWSTTTATSHWWDTRTSSLSQE